MFKLNISNAVTFTARINLNDAGALVTHKITFTGNRLDLGAIETGREAGAKTADFLAKNLTDWRDQTLVVLDDATADTPATPAPFGPAALAAVLAIPGASDAIAADYMRALLGTQGVEGRAKN